MNFNNFSVTLRDSKLKGITVDWHSVDYDSLVGTPIWDKVNNIISLANGMRWAGGRGYTGIVYGSGYESFVKYCLKIIYPPKYEILAE